LTPQSSRYRPGPNLLTHLYIIKIPQAIIFFIRSIGIDVFSHRLVLNYPKRAFSYEDCEKTLGELGFAAQEMVYVSKI